MGGIRRICQHGERVGPLIHKNRSIVIDGSHDVPT